MNKIEGDWCVGLDPSIKDKIAAYFKEFYNHKWQFGGVYYGVKGNIPICDSSYPPTLSKEQFLEKIGETVTTKKVTYGAYLKTDGTVMFLNKYESPVPIGADRGNYAISNWLSFNAKDPYYHNKSVGATPHREMTAEEIQWLEACIKANRFVPKEEALKANIPYKVGDWIVASCNESMYVVKVSSLKNAGQNYLLGTEWYVLGADKTKRAATKGGFDTFIRLATADEIPDSEDTNFKAGDWVVFEVNRCVGQYNCCKTSVWNADMVLRVQSVSNTNLNFDGSKSNNKALFRKARNEEILTATALSKEDLLAEAKRRYPIGTVIHSCYYNDRRHNKISSDDFKFYNNGHEISKDIVAAGTFVYYKGVWADKVQLDNFSGSPIDISTQSNTGYAEVYGVIQRKSELEHQDPIVMSSKRKKTNLITINN